MPGGSPFQDAGFPNRSADMAVRPGDRPQPGRQAGSAA